MELLRLRNFIVCQSAAGNAETGIQAKGICFFPLRTRELHALTFVAVTTQDSAEFGEKNGGTLRFNVRDSAGRKIMAYEPAIEIEPNRTRSARSSTFIVGMSVRFDLPGEFSVTPTLDGVKPSYLAPWILAAEEF